MSETKIHPQLVPAAPKTTGQRFVYSVRHRVAAIFAAVAVLVAVPLGAANAAGIPDGTTAGINTMFDDATTLIVTVLGVAAFALTIALLGIHLGMRWVRKVAQSN